MKPSVWADPRLGPFAVAKACVDTDIDPQASTATDADAPSLINILLHYPAVSQHLSAAVRANLAALLAVHCRGTISYWFHPHHGDNSMAVCQQVD